MQKKYQKNMGEQYLNFEITQVHLFIKIIKSKQLCY